MMRAWKMILGLLAVAAVVGLGAWWAGQPTTPPPDLGPADLGPAGDDPHPHAAAHPGSQWPPLPPVTETAFDADGEQSGYVGSQRCRECHAEQHDSWLQTMHSKALDDLDPDAEPPDGQFTHALSGRSYRVYRRNGQMRHEESITSPDGQKVVLADHAMKYVIGSGAYSRSYLLELDGFLTESPITWYSRREQWGLSPGYENDPQHPGFSRPAHLHCLECHVGRVQPVEQSLHRMRILEQPIGCERCHGPGEQHVARHSGDSDPPANGDEAIVHPGHLTRAQNEALCFQCHLTNDADVELRDRQAREFLPGELLSDYRQGFTVQTPDKAMRVVGHGQQMQLSRCYQETDSMTCTTCHNPHRPVQPAERFEYYRAKCLECHDEAACGLKPAERIARQGQDDCVACHMPVTDTEIPHFAFTHHRIGLHDGETELPSLTGSDAIPPVVPADPLPALSDVDRQRNRGLALLTLSESEAPQSHRVAYHREALRLLEALQAQGLTDPLMDTALARMLWQRDRQRTIRLARRALEADDLNPIIRRDALAVLSEALIGEGQWRAAREVLEELVEVRRGSDDWLKIGFCELQLGNVDSAIGALEQAIEIEPHRPEPHGLLTQVYVQSGDREKAEFHSERARLLASAPAE